MMKLFLLLLLGSISYLQAQEMTSKEAAHTLQNAGNPQQLHRFAIPSITKREQVGYIGGGKTRNGDAPLQYDGTFGMDYVGRPRFFNRIFLGWYHDRARQPLTPSYKVDGPRVLESIKERREK
jgi:hypothetical protein